MPNKISSALFAAESAGISQKPPLCNCKLRNPQLTGNKSQYCEWSLHFKGISKSQIQRILSDSLLQLFYVLGDFMKMGCRRQDKVCWQTSLFCIVGTSPNCLHWINIFHRKRPETSFFAKKALPKPPLSSTIYYFDTCKNCKEKRQSYTSSFLALPKTKHRNKTPVAHRKKDSRWVSRHLMGLTKKRMLAGTRQVSFVQLSLLKFAEL